MSHVFHRHTLQGYPIAARGEGAYIYDADGKKYLDASSGAAVSCLGYSHEAIKEAIIKQVEKFPYVHSGFFTTEPLEELAEELIQNAPVGHDSEKFFDKIYLVSGGSEANEAAIKMARQYFVETGFPDKKFVIGRKQSYHGNTLGALSHGGNQCRRKPFEPILLSTHVIDPCFAYHYKLDKETDEQYAFRAAKQLEDKIIELGPENVAAFIAETVVGATAGAVTAVDGYFRRIREICDRYNVLLILDEVMCGLGRTGKLHACEYDSIIADIMVVAKGLAAGYQPIGAVYVTNKVFEAFQKGSGFFQHGHTFMGHATACAAALATQKVIREDGLIAHVKKTGDYFVNQLLERFRDAPFIGDIRGRGFFLGIEFIADKTSKTSFEPSLKLYQQIKRMAFQDGLICYPMGGTVNGKYGDHLLLAPPYICQNEQIDEICDRLQTIFEKTFTNQLLKTGS